MNTRTVSSNLGALEFSQIVALPATQQTNSVVNPFPSSSKTLLAKTSSSWFWFDSKAEGQWQQMQSSHLYRQTGLSFPLFREPFVKSADGSQLRSGRGDFTWADGSSYSGALEPSRFSVHRVVYVSFWMQIHLVPLRQRNHPPSTHEMLLKFHDGVVL